MKEYLLILCHGGSRTLNAGVLNIEFEATDEKDAVKISRKKIELLIRCHCIEIVSARLHDGNYIDILAEQPEEKYVTAEQFNAKIDEIMKKIDNRNSKYSG